MRHTAVTLMLVLIGVGLVGGCQTAPGGGASVASGAGSGKRGGVGTGAETEAAILGYCAGEAIRWGDLSPALIELNGGTALSELVLDIGLRRELQRQGISIDSAAIEHERDLFAAVAGGDAHDAERLLREVRRNQGLGDVRFAQMLWRNAALRRLVAGEIEVPDALVRKAYDFEHGPKYRARLIVVSDIGTAAEVVEAARQGSVFTDLVVLHSTDSSRAQGGVLPAISPVDTTWPDGVRSVLGTLPIGGTSNPVMVDGGYAILRLEGIDASSGVSYEAVREDFARRARLGIERDAMDRLAREIIRSSDVIVMQRALKTAWDQQRRKMLGEAP